MPDAKFSWNELQDEVPYEGTRLESVADLRAAIGAGNLAFAPPSPPTPRTPPPLPSLPEAIPFRPVRRPPMALLIVLDDGRSEGEELRLRGDTFTIGRVEGDFKVPHDRLISGKHVSLTREADKGRVRWFINDLKSSNGTFLRAATAVLTDDQEVLIGGRRFAFNIAHQATPVAANDDNTTKSWSVLKPTDLHPTLTEVLPDGSDGQRFIIDRDSVEVGRDKACPIHLDDPMVSPKHAKIAKNEQGAWEIHNLNSLNGVWIRKPRMVVLQLAQFQIGEQRLMLKVL